MYILSLFGPLIFEKKIKFLQFCKHVYDIYCICHIWTLKKGDTPGFTVPQQG